MTTKKPATRSPTHLRPATRKWWEQVMLDYDLQEHHVRMLTAAAESWDRACEARELIARHGITYQDRYDCPRTRPEVRVEQTSKALFARLVRELGLDVAGPDEAQRPVGIVGKWRRG